MSEPSQSSSDSAKHSGYLYFGARRLCQLGMCSVSPSGRYVAYQDEPSDNLFVFCATDGRTIQLTSQPVARVERFDWHEDAHELEVQFTIGAETYTLP